MALASVPDGLNSLQRAARRQERAIITLLVDSLSMPSHSLQLQAAQLLLEIGWTEKYGPLPAAAANASTPSEEEVRQRLEEIRKLG